MSRINFSLAGICVCPLRTRKIIGRRGGEAFVPSGEGIGKRRLDNAGPNDAANDSGLGGDELFAERLRVGVDVGPAPPGRTLDAEISQARARPDLSFARDGQARARQDRQSSRPSSFRRLRARSRKRATIIASRASSRTRSASLAQSLISCSTENSTPGSSCLRGK